MKRLCRARCLACFWACFWLIGMSIYTAQAKPADFEISLEEEGRRRRNNLLEFVGSNAGLRGDEEVWPLDQYWEEELWYPMTGMHHSYEYGVDVRVPDWRTRREVPINNPKESFEFSKLIISFLRHHTVRQQRYRNSNLRLRINDYGYAYLEDMLIYANDNRAAIRRRVTGDNNPSLVVLSLRDLLAILRAEKSRYVVIGKRSSIVQDNFTVVPWMVRAIEGHSSAAPYLSSIATPIPMVSAPLIDLTTECPKCGTVVCGGQLLCFSGHAIFLFAGTARLYSPILSGVVNMMSPLS